MKYYTLRMFYVGTKVRLVDGDEDGEAFKSLSEAAKEADSLLKAHGINSISAYGWPDGTLYNYVASEKDRLHLYEDIQNAFKDAKSIMSFSISEFNPPSDPTDRFFENKLEVYNTTIKRFQYHNK